MCSKTFSMTMLVLMEAEALAMAMPDDETIIQVMRRSPCRNTRRVKHVCKPFPRIQVLIEISFLRSEALIRV